MVAPFSLARRRCLERLRTSVARRIDYLARLTCLQGGETAGTLKSPSDVAWCGPRRHRNSPRWAGDRVGCYATQTVMRRSCT